MEYGNCWEVMDCGRQPSGEKAEKDGVCPAADAVQYDGINKGKNGGRFCWAIEGTLCNGQVQGTFAKKLKNCLQCKFFQQVCHEEERDFIMASKNILP